MYSVKFYLVSFVIGLSFIWSQSAAPPNVVYLLVVNRNGESAPKSVFSTNPNQASYWNAYDGLDRMTFNGYQNQFNLGRAFTAYYAGSTNNLTVYSSELVKVRSTSDDKCIQSAQAFLMGAFTVSSTQTWVNAVPIGPPRPNILYWPAAVRNTDPLKDDIFPIRMPCPRLESARQRVFDSRDARNEQSRRSRLLARLSSITNLPLSLVNLDLLLDNILADEAEGLPLLSTLAPDFADIKTMFATTYDLIYGRLEISRLIGSALLNQIVTELTSKINRPSMTRISYMSVTDEYIAALMRLLQVTDPITQPDFGSALIFELSQDVDSQYYIRLLFSDKTNNFVTNPSGMVKTMSDCDSFCKFSKFLSNTKPYLINTNRDLCMSTGPMPRILEKRPRTNY